MVRGCCGACIAVSQSIEWRGDANDELVAGAGRDAGAMVARMGWRGSLRSYQAAVRREQREARRRLRELVREHKEAERRAEQEHAEQAVARYEAMIEALTSVHRECGPRVDWASIAGAQPPSRPTPVTSGAAVAEQVRDAYRPGLFARLFGTAPKRRAALEAEVAAARERDRQATELSLQAHAQQCEEHAASVAMARAVLAGDLEAYVAALDELDVFEELRELGVEIEIAALAADVVRVQLIAQERQVVPGEQASLTARGKLSLKKLSNTRGNEIYQDYICGAALRTVREVFAALPVQWVIATVRTDLLDAATGHIRSTAVLSVVAPRATLAELRFERLDPSEAMAKFLCRMKFKKGAGLAEVEPFELGDVPRGARVLNAAT